MKTKKIILFTYLFFIILSCKNKSIENTDVKEIHLDLIHIENFDFKKVFSHIELLPLESNESSLIGNFFSKNIIHIPDKYFIIIDKNHIVHIFNTKGKHISNSSSCIGEAPQQYHILQHLTYNQNNNGIDILDVHGNIISFDINFNFISKTKVSIKPKNRFNNIFSLNNHLYALMDDTEKGTIYLYDRRKNKLNKKIYYRGLIVPQTAALSPFKPTKNALYFIPNEINDYIFTFNEEEKELVPLIHINSGDKALKSSDIKNPDIYSMEVAQYISSECNKYHCIDRLYNDKYLISTYLKQQKACVNICCLETNENFSFSKKQERGMSFPFHSFFALNGNILYSIIHPFDMGKYIDMDILENKKIINKIQEDDNPLIVKYYLK